ncbi:MAG: cation:proton antiporter [Sphaerospermopsis sp. SIO1G1]|nr:cation:proton antiporter [Sphaerospermopsis sp. SIO1G1]
MKWVYILAGIALFIKILFMPEAESNLSDISILKKVIDNGIPEALSGIVFLDISIAETVSTESGVPNAVSGILFRNRLYDTIMEVIVFSVSILGCNYLLANENPSCTIYQFNDQPSIILARLGATITAIVGIELAIRGHLSPGGGFAAGVAGGTAIGLIAITSSYHWMQDIYKSWHAAKWEKVSVVIFIILSVLTLIGIELPHGQLGELFSGGILPILNILVAIKVALGSWAVLLMFIHYRGLL